jgi:daunorubicin resistance ABC transporter ATP-binding subunit
MSYSVADVLPSQRAEPTATPAVEIVNLCKKFGTSMAVDHLSFTVRQGEIFGLLGPNGSGKTTTINMISGLSMPTSGEISILGQHVRRGNRKIRQLLGTVPQETALYEDLTAWANLDFHADLFGIPRKEKKQRITRMLDLIQLLDRKDERVSTFSGGMKRRLALGRALLHEPPLVYLDEPSLGVDVQTRRALWEYIRFLRQQGKTILITTNYLEEAQALCDRLAIIDHGKLVVLDTLQHIKSTYGGQIIELATDRPVDNVKVIRNLRGVKDVFQDGNHLKVTVSGGEHTVPQIINLIAQEGTLCDIALREPNLDDIFLHLTGTAFRD